MEVTAVFLTSNQNRECFQGALHSLYRSFVDLRTALPNRKVAQRRATVDNLFPVSKPCIRKVIHADLPPPIRADLPPPTAEKRADLPPPTVQIYPPPKPVRSAYMYCRIKISCNWQQQPVDNIRNKANTARRHALQHTSCAKINTG